MVLCVCSVLLMMTLSMILIEIEKVAIYHCVKTYCQRLVNQEGCMARQGLDPISRKAQTQGRNRSGYVVYLAYQLVECII